MLVRAQEDATGCAMGGDSLHQGKVRVDTHDAVDIQFGGITVRLRSCICDFRFRRHAGDLI